MFSKKDFVPNKNQLRAIKHLDYNPDWGIIRLDENKNVKLELVRETKGNIDTNLLQFRNEKRKIDCANKHFKAIGIDYRTVDDKVPNYWEPAN